MASDLLGYLSPGSWVSGQEIASKLRISRAAVWKQIQALRAKGFEIESATRMGYRLSRGQDLLDPSLILQGLQTQSMGRHLKYCREISSTNEAALDLASQCPEGTVVLAEVQTKGRGRMSRSWQSPPGGVWMSLILKPDLPVAQSYRINMAVSVGIARALARLYGLKASIKWPNDILIGERKLCGILTEIRAEMDRLEYAVVGIGLNANVDVESFPDDWMATSLSRELCTTVPRIELIQHLLKDAEETCRNIGSSEIYYEWVSLSATLGRRVRIASSEGVLEGEAIFLSEDGALDVKISDGIRRIWAGDCIHLRTM